MSAIIVLIACGKSKRPTSLPARDLYTGDLFRKSMAYASALLPDAIYILSAKHGLVNPDEIITPYDLTISRMPRSMRLKWAERVFRQISFVSDPNSDRFIILAGNDYRRHLMPRLSHAEAPLAGMPIGRQLSWLKSRIS